VQLGIIDQEHRSIILDTHPVIFQKFVDLLATYAERIRNLPHCEFFAFHVQSPGRKEITKR
tara:strand:- start:325 stop:507 length:183 start_codon:yes stop_codon:yes gene_type:complete